MQTAPMQKSKTVDMKHFLSLVLLLISFCAFAQNDSISVAKRTLELQEVVVKATRPLSKFDTNGIITTISGTPLQSLETAQDVLGYIPGVVNNNGSIEVVGKGRPLIYINGRKLVNLTELAQLPAAKVKDIKLINNPGARYDGSTSAVIRISTEKEIGDGFSLDNRATIGYKNFFYGKNLIGLNYRHEGLDVFGSIDYANTRSKGCSMVSNNQWGAHSQSSTISINTHKWAQRIEGKIGFNFSTGSSHSFGAYYQHIYTPEKSNAHNLTATTLDDIMQSETIVNVHTRNRGYNHLIDAYYSGNWGQWSVDASFDYLWRKSNERQDIIKSGPEHPSPDKHLHDNNTGRMFAGEFHLSHALWKGNIEIGAEYTSTNRKDNYISDVPGISNNNDEIKENDISAYLQLSQRFGPLVAQAGLRYEHIIGDYYEFGQKKTGQCATYNELLPSASLMMPLGKTVFQLAYSRKYARPLYSQLSSTLYYVNPYTYEIGNPNLKSSYTDNLSLNFRFKWLMVMAAYKHTNDRVITECTEYQGNPDITLFQKQNSKNDINSIEAIVSAMPGFIGKFYYPVVMAGVVAQFYAIDYRGETKHMNSPMALVRLNNMFRLPGNYMVNLNLNYRSSFDGENIHMRQTWQIDFSASKSFNRNWNINLSINDIFNTARKSGLTIYSGIRNVQNIRFNTLRGVEISVNYKFNTTKSKYKGKGAGNSERERL